MNFLIQFKRNTIPGRHFRTKLKRNLTLAIKISQHTANTAYYAIFDRKRVNDLLKKANIYQHCHQTETKLSSMSRIALFLEKNFESAE